MPVKELITNSLGKKANGYEILIATGQTGSVYTNIGHWLVSKKKVGISVTDVTTTVLVANNGGKGWLAFEETLSNGDILRTVFETF